MKPEYHSFNHLESERLRFRRLTKEDISRWEPFFENNHSLHFFGFPPGQTGFQLAEMWINLQIDRYSLSGLGHLAVELKNSGDFIGMGGILPREFGSNKEFEVAYSLLQPFWGKGYATEIAIRMKEYAFENMKAKRVISIIHRENTGSIKVAEKNGMKLLKDIIPPDMTEVIYSTSMEAYLANS